MSRLIGCGALFLNHLGFHESYHEQFRYSLWWVELAWEALVNHLEFNSVVLNVVYLEGA